MKKTYFKYIVSSIKNDFTRLLAIFLIVLLGVGFVVGLLSTTPDLQASVDTYYDEYNVQDIYIQSTLGFNEDDHLTILENVDDIDKIEIHYEEDLQGVYLNDERIQARVNYRTFDEDAIDGLTLVEGHYPTSADECVMLEINNDTMTDYEIGDYIYIDDNGYEIVGIVTDPIYLAAQSISTTVGSGTLNAICYLDETYFDASDFTYTIIKITFTSAKDLDTFSDEYDTYINQKVSEIQLVANDVLDKRLDTLMEEARETAIIEAIRQIDENYLDLIDDDATDEEILEAYNSLSDSLKSIIDSLVNETLTDEFSTLNAQWYVLTRGEIEAFALFETDSTKVDALAAVFPVFFFLIALLVSISSISRLVSKDRQLMGTFKSLGFGKGAIFSKYFIASLLFSLLGALVGSTIGIFVLPYIIYIIYAGLYNLPSIVFTYQVGYIALFSSLIVAAIVAVVCIICFTQLKESCSSLILGKAPIAGKKILIERIKPIWKRLNFSIKSMLRNVFRFKKNLIMMLIGVGGCTALLLTGFGMKDSLSVLSSDQYEIILNYDLVIKVNDIDEPIDLLSEATTYSQVYTYDGDVMGDETIAITLYKGEDLDTYFGFDDDITFDANSVIVTKQIANELNLKVGDSVQFKLDDAITNYSLTITGITTNYINNYIFLGDSIANFLFSSEGLGFNSYLVITDMDDDELETYINELLQDDNVSSVTSKISTQNIYSNVISNLTAVVVIIVLLSGALIAVVIYNLTDIIINERVKEIATLRVNGYQLKEALIYVYKEILFMTLLGIIIGLILGVFLHQFVINVIGSIGICFGTTIYWPSYIYTILLTVAFVTLTILIFYPKIKKISMTEALKSVD